MIRGTSGSPQAQLTTFMARYRPEVAETGRAALTAGSGGPATRQRQLGAVDPPDVADDIEKPGVRALIAEAVTRAEPPLESKDGGS